MVVNDREVEIISDRGVYTAALASLPQLGPRRLHRLLSLCDPAQAWQRIAHKHLPGDIADQELLNLWAAHVADIDLEVLAHKLERLDIWVTTPADSSHPKQFVDDIDLAPVIFRQGKPVVHEIPMATIVGTRRCSPTGRSIAYELGAGLAESGVVVVSGLALGIDGAAHKGALSVNGVAPVGVVGSGLNVTYPRGHSDLWREMAETGTLLSEVPLDGKPERWRFPARNRLLAALADVVVVVESKKAGGSMHTVEEAIRRGVTVMAVPGSVRNPAAAGTNKLISEGCAPACGVEDVLTAISLSETGLLLSRNSFLSADRVEVGGCGLEGINLSADDMPQQEFSMVQPADRVTLLGSNSDDTSQQCLDVFHPDAQTRHPARDYHDTSQQCLDVVHQQLLAAVDDNPVSIDTLVARAGKPIPVVLGGIAKLEALGLLVLSDGKVVRC